MEKCSIVVSLRDRFSTTERCLDTLIQNTPEPYDLFVVMGSVPERLKQQWAARYGDKVRWIFKENFLNPPVSRNLALAEVTTRLAVLMDNDVFVRPGWLSPLIACQAETGAAMVTPVILEREEQIHTAGNDFVITHKKGKAFGCKELRYGKLAYYEDSNLKRERTDYGELHCQLVEVETAKRLHAYDDRYREGAEVDSGLTWAKAGCSLWFEPKSVVYFNFPDRIATADDVKPFLFKWDTAAIVDSYGYFEKKWGIDLTEGGSWKNYLVYLNSKVGTLARIFPSEFGMGLDATYQGFKGLFRWPGQALSGIRSKILGRGAWK